MTRQSPISTLSIWRPALCLAGTVSALAIAAPAQAQMRGGTDIRVGGEVVANPYLEQGSSDTTASASAMVSPWLRFEDSQTVYTVNGSVEGRLFADRYDFEDNYTARMGVVHRASERVTLNANAGIFSTATSFSSLLGGIDPSTLPDDFDLIDDVTVFGQPARSSAVSVGAGASVVFDQRNQLQISGDFQDNWFSRVGLEDYRRYGTQARFSHVIDQATSVGAVLSYQLSDYRDNATGDAETVTTMGSVVHRLGQYWTLDVSAGASFSRVDATAVTPEIEFTSFSTEASLCGRTERRGICFEYRRSPQPSALGGMRNSDNLDVTFDERLSERDRVALGLGYIRNGRSRSTLAPTPSIDYLTLSGRFSRQFSERLSGFVAGRFSRVSRSDLSVDPSMSVSVGITVNLGQRR